MQLSVSFDDMGRLALARLVKDGIGIESFELLTRPVIRETLGHAVQSD